MPSLSQQQVSEAGEHYVLYSLYMRGMVGGQAPRGMPETDLLVMTPEGATVATVQVKARSVARGRTPGWHMQAKHEQMIRNNLYYVFVGLEVNPPLTYIIPSRVVADVVSEAHRAWLATPGHSGQQRNNSKFRWITSDYKLPLENYPPGWIERYRERWDLVTSASVDLLHEGEQG